MSAGTIRQAIASADRGGVDQAMATVRTSHLCVMCGRRRAVFRYRGVVKADATHTLCFQCYRSLRDAMRAQRLASMASGFMSELFRIGVR